MNRSSRSLPVLLGLGALILTGGCGHCPPPPPPPQCPAVYAPPPLPLPTAPVAATTPTPTPVTSIVVKDAGLQTPECVLWDADQDVYFVANINGDPTAADKNGFISKIAPDGKVIDLKWIDSGKKGVELSAPKGLAVAGNLLFVADLDTVRKFDRKTGKPKGKIAVKDAVFLNGLAISPDQKVLYVSDTAVKINEGGFAGTGADAIYEIDLRKKSVKPLIKDQTLRWPNGILADETGIWSVSLGKNELVHVNYKGELGAVTKLPKGSLDGIVRLADKSLLISSWEGQAIYRGLPGGEFTEVITGVPSPAGIGLDSKRSSVLIPIFTGNGVEIHALPMLPILEAPAAPAPTSTAPATPTPGQVDVPAPPVPSAQQPRAPAPASAPMKLVAPAPGSGSAPVPAAPSAPAAAPVPAAPPAPAAPPPPARAPAAPTGPRPTKWQ